MGRNWDFSKQQGREDRLKAECHAYQTGASVPACAPFFSHCATMQAYFVLGWNGVSAYDIRRALGIATTPQGTDLIQKIRSLKQCHFR
jgi:hypothetical protein